LVIFFFQAEDGIRDRNVTGVQTCALPIYKNKNYLDQISELKEKGLKNNFQDYLINDLQEKYRLGVLQLIPRNKRDNDNKTEYQKLINKHVDVSQISVKKINEEIVAQKNKYIDEWLKVVKNTKDPNEIGRAHV